MFYWLNQLFNEPQVQLRHVAFNQQELWKNANERVPWHEKLEGEEAVQNRVHEYFP